MSPHRLSREPAVERIRRGPIFNVSIFILQFFFLASCFGGPQRIPPVPLGGLRTPEELRRALESIARRTDHEAAIGRARIYARLREAGAADPSDLLGRGDAADVELLAQPAPPEYKVESARRVSLHFRERAAHPALRRTRYEGPVGDALHRFVLLTVSSYFAEYASGEEHGEVLEGLAEAAEALGQLEAVRPDFQQQWRLRARLYLVRAADAQADGARPGPTVDARKFCEYSLGRHLEEGTRTADYGTREKVARGDEVKVLDWYLEGLAHFLLAREALVEPRPAESNAMAAQDVVVRSVGDLLCAPK